jgi:hypothetical protein
MNNCNCSTHLKNEEIRIEDRSRERAKYLEIIKNAESMVALLGEEEADPKNNKPKPCLGHDTICPCTKTIESQKNTVDEP